MSTADFLRYTYYPITLSCARKQTWQRERERENDFSFPKLIALQTADIVIKSFLTNGSLDEANVNMNRFPWHVCTLRHEALLKELTEQLTECICTYLDMKKL